ncbi:MAG: hypothetical protein ABSG86_26865 [Thermoguttaceae bacterium]|jgi:hypothetical protein
MNTNLSPVPTPAPSGSRPPLGLPSGSIRAVLALLVVAVVVVEIARGQEVDLLWTETLMIVLAHYFTSRRFINLSPDLIRRLAAEGHIEAETRPLYLPRYSIRAILVLMFLGLGLYLQHEGRLLRPEAISVLGVVAAYFAGMVARFRGLRGWEDVKAALVLLVLGFTALPYFAGCGASVPHWLRTVALVLVLFYFGSR